MPFKDIHDGALKKSLGIVYVAVDVLRGVVAQNFVCDGVDDRALKMNRRRERLLR